MKHQGPEIHLGEEAKDGVPRLMKSDDQGRTRGNCMLGFAWLSLLSLSGRTGFVLLKEEEVGSVLASSVEAFLFFKKGEQPLFEARRKFESARHRVLRAT